MFSTKKSKMKNLFKTILILVAVFTINACNNDKKASEKTIKIDTKEALLLVIDNQKAGQFAIGKKIPLNLKENVLIENKTRNKTEEGTTFTEKYTSVSKNGTILLNTMLSEEGLITEITVVSNQFKTAKNIGVQNTIEEFTKAYPNYNIWYSYVGNIFVIESSTLKAQFLLHKDDFKGDSKKLYSSDLVQLKPSDFKTNAKIISVRII